MLYEKDVKSCSKSKLADKLSAELKELKIICRKNLYYAQELHKRAYNKRVNPRSYASSDKV